MSNVVQETFLQKSNKAKKMMLWFGMVSMAMTFAGLTSAYVVSKSRPDWLQDFSLPSAFFISTGIILLSSLTFYMAKKEVKRQNNKAAIYLLLITLVLGLLFVFFQFQGFSQVVASGYYFTGSESSITTSFIYAIVFAHIIHVSAGILVLLVVLYNTIKSKYKPSKMLGLELGITFWHFLDFLWLYLILFFYFFR